MFKSFTTRVASFFHRSNEPHIPRRLRKFDAYLRECIEHYLNHGKRSFSMDMDEATDNTLRTYLQHPLKVKLEKEYSSRGTLLQFAPKWGYPNTCGEDFWMDGCLVVRL